MSTNSFTPTSDFKMLTDEDEIVVSRTVAPFDPELHVVDHAPESFIHYNLRTVSYSFLCILHLCPRKFELNRLFPNRKNEEEDTEGHLDFGSVVGIGAQELLQHGNMNRAMFAAFLAWKDNLESERGEKHAKTFWHALQAIQKFTELLYGPLAQYELAYFNGAPAVELGFTIDCGNGFRYHGKLDALLIHKIKKEFLVIDFKTTGRRDGAKDAMYGMSSQCVGYSVVVDAVAHQLGSVLNSYDVLYAVYQTHLQDWTCFKFTKSSTQRAVWLQSLLFDIQNIQSYAEMGYFPTRGENCMSFNRVCPHYGTCTLSNESLFGPQENIPNKWDTLKDYPLEFSLEQLVEAQVEKE